MEELFTILSSSARLTKSKRQKKPRSKSQGGALLEDDHELFTSTTVDQDTQRPSSQKRMKKNKPEHSDEKKAQIHKEHIAAFRRAMSIRIMSDKNDPDLSDPVASFRDVVPPSWWKDNKLFQSLTSGLLNSIEAGNWKEPTPIQMQAIPCLLAQKDFIGAAPTGSGKSGAFILPALWLSSAPYNMYYNDSSAAAAAATTTQVSDVSIAKTSTPTKKKRKGRTRDQAPNDMMEGKGRAGEIRTILLAPVRELALQLYREVERLGTGKTGGLSSLLLSKANAAQVISGNAGGKQGLDILVSTPMRLVDAISKGVNLGGTRLLVLDEADRLLDSGDGNKRKNGTRTSSSEQHQQDTETITTKNERMTFLAQMDTILDVIPRRCTRALFSATVTEKVHELAESILRNPVDVKITGSGSTGGANPDIKQELTFVGREEGKLLAIRQLKLRGELKLPAIVFVQSQERAQALFTELLYDGLHVDCIHAARSRTARDNAVAKFRKGETWVLICTDLVARGVDFRAVNMVINYDLPSSGITYVHRIGRTGRAGRKGRALTLFTEADFENLRTIANVMKQSGCKVEEWMLQLRSRNSGNNRNATPRRTTIDTTAEFHKKQKKWKKPRMVENSKKRKTEAVD